MVADRGTAVITLVAGSLAAYLAAGLVGYRLLLHHKTNPQED